MAPRTAQPISEGLRAALRNSGRAQAELARTIGIYPSVLCRFANGERGLRLDVADALARELGLEIKARKAPRRKR